MPLPGTSYQPGTFTGADPLRPSTQPPQEAVRVLNLRLPKSQTAGPIPQSLLRAAGGGSVTSLDALLRALMAAFSGQGGGNGREVVGPGGPGIDTGRIGVSTAPPPRIRPGDTGAPPAREELPPMNQPAQPLFGAPAAVPGFDQNQADLWRQAGVSAPLF